MTKKHPFTRKSQNRSRGFDWKTDSRAGLALYAIFGIAFCLLLVYHLLPEPFEIREGELSPVTVVSPVTKVDPVATEQAREEAARNVPEEYSIDQVLTSRTVARVDELFARVAQIVRQPVTEQEKIGLIRQVVDETTGHEFSASLYATLAKTSPERLERMRKDSRDIILELMEKGIRKSDLDDAKKQVDRLLLSSLLDRDAPDQASRSAVKELVREMLTVNAHYDAEKTEKKRATAKESVDPVLIREGQVIVAEGEPVTKRQIRQLELIGLVKSHNKGPMVIGLALFVTLLLVILHLTVRRLDPETVRDNRRLALLLSVLLLTMAGMKGLALGQNPEWSTLGYLTPCALGVMLPAILLRPGLGLISSVFLSVAAGMVFQDDSHSLFDYRFGFVVLVGGITAALSLIHVRNRSRIFRAGLASGLASAAAAASIQLMNPSGEAWTDLVVPTLFAFGGGCFSAILTYGFLPVFESGFGILSPMRLLELGNPNQPLLRRLLTEAPGTYHHSVMVANLAEAAAEAVGADGLLARVGAYYHDVGKLKRPQFFIENQMGRENPHDRLSPALSRTVIINHARDGAEMLKKAGLPEKLQDIAAQHHGTTLLKYFYHKALLQNDGPEVKEEDYRYPGPKARSREAAIIGICDCVEAAVRSMAHPTPSRVETLVRKIIRERLEDGQFDECDLTMKELDLIARSVCETLQGLFHTRIEYPEETLREKGAKHHEPIVVAFERGNRTDTRRPGSGGAH